MAIRERFNQYLSQLYVAGLWEAKVHELAVKHWLTMVHDEIIFDSPENAAKFMADLEHWWEAQQQGGSRVAKAMPGVQDSSQQTSPTRQAGDL